MKADIARFIYLLIVIITILLMFGLVIAFMSDISTIDNVGHSELFALLPINHAIKFILTFMCLYLLCGILLCRYLYKRKHTLAIVTCIISWTILFIQSYGYAYLTDFREWDM